LFIALFGTVFVVLGNLNHFQGTKLIRATKEKIVTLNIIQKFQSGPNPAWPENHVLTFISAILNATFSCNRVCSRAGYSLPDEQLCLYFNINNKRSVGFILNRESVMSKWISLFQ